jgi:hypothetical protein
MQRRATAELGHRRYGLTPMVPGCPFTDPGRMLTVFVWVFAGTAMWHFAVLVPDRFYRGIIGAFAAANAGAVTIGFAASGFVLPDAPQVADSLIGLAGALAGLAFSWFAGPRYDPVLLDEMKAGHRPR